MILQLPEVLQGRYQLLRQLGHHAHRQTWLAKDSLSQNNVVVKLLAFSPQMQWDEFKLFEREGQILKQLNHPRIPQYQDYFALDEKIAGLHWFALVHTYIPGHSLQELLDQGSHFTESQIRSIATDILKILIYLHELNHPILHRDIKPSNLILSKNQQVYLVDFGAVQDPVAIDGATFTVVGTAGYAPLEQFWGKAMPASDLYALGATLIHLLTGIEPINLPQQNLRLQFRDQVSINPTLIQWIETLTEPDLNCRFKTAAEALEFLKTGHSYQSSPVFYPPQKTQILVNKTQEHLKIEIPKPKLSLQEILTILLNVLLLGFSFPFQMLVGISSFLLILVSFAMLIEHLTFAIFMLTFVGFMIKIWIDANLEIGLLQGNLNEYFLSYFGYKKIKFDATSFTIDSSFFGENTQSGLLSEIYSVDENSREGITLKLVKNSYLSEIFIGSYLTKAERKWLIQEIREWVENHRQRLK